MQTVTSPDAPQGVRQVVVGPERDGQRIDNALMTLLKGVPKSMIYRLLRTGQVRVNGKRAKPDTRLADGDTLRIPPVRVAEREEGRAPATGLVASVADAILFEDKHFLVIDKPSGVASHGGSGVSHGAIELLRAGRPALRVPQHEGESGVEPRRPAGAAQGDQRGDERMRAVIHLFGDALDAPHFFGRLQRRRDRDAPLGRHLADVGGDHLQAVQREAQRRQRGGQQRARLG